MSAVALTSALSAAPVLSPAVKDAGPDADKFAGVLATVGAKPDALTRRKAAAGASASAEGEAATDAAASPDGGDQAKGAAPSPGTVDVSLLVQAALISVPRSSADAVAPPTGNGQAEKPTRPAVATSIGPSGAPSDAAAALTPTPAAKTDGSAGAVDQSDAAACDSSSASTAAVSPLQAPSSAALSARPSAGISGAPSDSASSAPERDAVAQQEVAARATTPAPVARHAGSSSPVGVQSAADLQAVDTEAVGGAAVSGRTPLSRQSARSAATGREDNPAALQRNPAASPTAGQVAPVTPTTDPGVASTPVAQQVATALQSFVERSGSASASAAGSTLAATSVTHAAASTSPDVKTLTVELDPGHLGPVSITLKMTGQTVNVHIAATNIETLHMLERDRSTLTAAVVAMGGSADTLQLGPASASTTSSDGLPGGSSGSQAAFSSDASTAGRQGQSTMRQASGTNPETTHDDPMSTTSSSNARQDGSLYL